MDVIFKPIFKQSSSIGFVTGKRGSGKTDICLLLLEEGKKEGYWHKMASNADTYNNPDINYICYMDRLEDWLKLPGRKVFFLDELGKHLYRMGFMSKLARRILELCQLIRKYDAHLIGAAPSEKLINKLFLNQDLLDYYMKKLSKRKLFVKTYPPFKAYAFLEDIPRTNIRFRTKHIATLDLTDPKKDKEKFEGMRRSQKSLILYGIYKNLRQPAKILGVSHQTIKNDIDKETSKYKSLQVSTVKEALSL